MTDKTAKEKTLYKVVSEIISDCRFNISQTDDIELKRCEHKKAVEQVLELVEQEARKALPKWIDVNDKLPNKGRSESVLALTKISTGIKGEFEYHLLRGYVYLDDNNKWYWSWDEYECINEVTHWMPLPSTDYLTQNPIK